MSQMITLPDLWLLAAPCGCLEGWLRATHEGTITRATAEIAWTDFEPRKRFTAATMPSGMTARKVTARTFPCIQHKH